MGNFLRKFKSRACKVEVLPPENVTTHVVHLKIGGKLRKYSLLPLLTYYMYPTKDLDGKKSIFACYIKAEDREEIYRKYYNNIIHNVEIVRKYLFEFNSDVKDRLMSFLKRNDSYIRKVLPYTSVRTLLYYQYGHWMNGEYKDNTFKIMDINCSFASLTGPKMIERSTLEEFGLLTKADKKYFCSSKEQGIKEFKSLLDIIHRAPKTNCHLTVWRKDTFQELDEKRVGDTIAYPSFVSTSFLKTYSFEWDFSFCCLLKIKVNPSVVPCIALMDSLNAQEYELVLSPCIFKVTAVYRKKGKSMFPTENSLTGNIFQHSSSSMSEIMENYYKVIEVTAMPGNLEWIDTNVVSIS